MQVALQHPGLTEDERSFYRSVLRLLNGSGLPYLVGGAYAFARYTGIERHTKDFDLFLRKRDFEAIAAVLTSAGFQTERTFPHWLGKAYSGDSFVDLIYAAGNGIAVVDDLWFEYSVASEVFGTLVKLIPPEEMIWSKGLIMERERYDGADVIHLIHAQGENLDWSRLLERFSQHWRPLLSHLILYGFVYPGEREKVPAEVIRQLLRRLEKEIAVSDASSGNVCYGPILSRAQYLHDIHNLGFQDARLQPRGNMSAEDIRHWTAAIDWEE